MTMSGTCPCGCFLWYDSVECLLKHAKKCSWIDGKDYEELKKHFEERRPNGILICKECGKQYDEHEFSMLKDCRGYEEHSSYTSDPEIAYQQAIANAYQVRYNAENNAASHFPGLPILIISFMIALIIYTIIF